jgi:hypothetical protein
LLVGGMIFSHARQWFGFVFWVNMVTAHTILANVTMATNALNLLQGKNNIKAVMLPW